MKQESQKVDEK